MHKEQVYAMECLLRVSQPPQADPLTWILTRSGYQLAGRHLLLATYLSAHRTMINGSALCAALAVTERD
jgi:hypothetical protein